MKSPKISWPYLIPLNFSVYLYFDRVIEMVRVIAVFWVMNNLGCFIIQYISAGVVVFFRFFISVNLRKSKSPKILILFLPD